MSAPKMGQEGLQGAQKALKAQQNGARMTQAEVWNQNDCDDDGGNTSFFCCSDHP